MNSGLQPYSGISFFVNFFCFVASEIAAEFSSQSWHATAYFGAQFKPFALKITFFDEFRLNFIDMKLSLDKLHTVG